MDKLENENITCESGWDCESQATHLVTKVHDNGKVVVDKECEKCAWLDKLSLKETCKVILELLA